MSEERTSRAEPSEGTTPPGLRPSSARKRASAAGHPCTRGRPSSACRSLVALLGRLTPPVHTVWSYLERATMRTLQGLRSRQQQGT